MDFHLATLDGDIYLFSGHNGRIFVDTDKITEYLPPVSGSSPVPPPGPTPQCAP